MSRASTQPDDTPLAVESHGRLAAGSRSLPSLTSQPVVVVIEAEPADGRDEEWVDDPPNRLYVRLVVALDTLDHRRERWLRDTLEAIDTSPADLAAGDVIALEPELRAIADANPAPEARRRAHVGLDRLLTELMRSRLSSTR